MRLTGGDDKGRRLASPRGDHIRPTSDRVREAVFNILGCLEGRHVLDLFSGAGTLGLEALSRGAESAWFVDCDPCALSVLRRSIDTLEYGARSRIIRSRAPAVVESLSRSGRVFDLIFLDPPYGSADLEPTLVGLGRKIGLSQSGSLVVEHDRDAVLQDRYDGMSRVDERRYGRTVISFFENRKACP